MWVTSTQQQEEKQFSTGKITKYKKARETVVEDEITEKTVIMFVCVFLYVFLRLPNRGQLWFRELMGSEGGRPVLPTRFQSRPIL